MMKMADFLGFLLIIGVVLGGKTDDRSWQKVELRNRRRWV
jgi:hypothetical protein